MLTSSLWWKELMDSNTTKVFSFIKNIIISPLDVLSPKHCFVCEKSITADTNVDFVCDECYYNFPLAPAPDIIMNRLAENFPPDDFAISNAIALFKVAQNSDYMKIIHSIKYYGFRRVGFQLGCELGKLIKNQLDESYDYIVPVPIHSARFRERGFNQAEILAKGIAQILNVNVHNKLIKRVRYTTTQTLLSGEERKTNVMNVFSGYNKNTKLNNEQILVVDDVLTTGSTINECAKTLLNIGARRVDIASLAVAG
ncbi:MAG: phosphoribosyltransferase family protein [Candidatus Kapabacteria bacterium]|nr:phosphoribosyltransferase family protein [Candidatus Kapabacteria bacterium]